MFCLIEHSSSLFLRISGGVCGHAATCVFVIAALQHGHHGTPRHTPFEMSASDLLLEFLIIVFDAPAQCGKTTRLQLYQYQRQDQNLRDLNTQIRANTSTQE